MSEQLSEMITEAFAMQNAEENITPMQTCHNCWRAAKHYSEKKALGQHFFKTFFMQITPYKALKATVV